MDFTMEMFNRLQEILVILINNPEMLILAFQWGLGFFLKNKTEMPNQLIPLILLGTGIASGIALLSYGLITNGLIGALVSFLAMGAFDSIRAIKSATELNK